MTWPELVGDGGASQQVSLCLHPSQSQLPTYSGQAPQGPRLLQKPWTPIERLPPLPGFC